jgi:hypothetical protein
MATVWDRLGAVIKQAFNEGHTEAEIRRMVEQILNFHRRP